MNNKKLTKHYNKFTIEERIDLIMKASQREDREEIKRLIDLHPIQEDKVEEKIDLSMLTKEELQFLAKIEDKLIERDKVREEKTA